MIKINLPFVIGIIFLVCSFVPSSSGDLSVNFLKLIDESKFAEASALTSADFKVIYNYSGGEKNKTAYFDNCKKRAPLKPVNHVDSIYESNGKIICMVKNSSELNNLLKLKTLPLKYSFEVVNDSINKMFIDSTKGYMDSSRINDRRWKYFEDWVKKSHPNSNIYYIKLQHNDSLMMLAEEFYSTQVKK